MADKNPTLAVARLAELVRRVYASTDTEDVLEETVNGVVDVLGYGVAAIARLEGDSLVMTNVAGPEGARSQILGRRTPAHHVMDEFREADRWGILRFVPAGRMSDDRLDAAWIPDIEPVDSPDAWHPEDALYAPLYTATGELIGNMAVDLPPGGVVPSQPDRELLEMFVVQAGLALTAARERDRLSERVRLGEMLKRVALTGSQRGLDAVLAGVPAAVVEGLRCEQVWVRCFPDRPGGAEHVASHPRPMEADDDIATLRDDFAVPDPAPVMVHIDDLASAALPRSLEGVRTVMALVGGDRAMAVPLARGGELRGYMVIAFAPQRAALSDDELEAVVELSRELGQMIQQARVLETEQRLVEELRELARYRSELIATISHELKTPLTAILGHAELMQERNPDELSIQAIIRNTGRLTLLVNNLLTYSRVQGRLDTVHRPVDVDDLCRGSLELLELRASRGQVELEYAPYPGQVTVFGDPEELGRVMDNLVDNAVKYTRPGGRVRVVVEKLEDEVRLRVSDTGIGISEHDQGRMFSAFHRSTDPNALSIPGTGLGLPIAQRIVEAHGGRIEVVSRYGAGSTFCIILPVP